jgi:hypothetical protein
MNEQFDGAARWQRYGAAVRPLNLVFDPKASENSGTSS